MCSFHKRLFHTERVRSFVFCWLLFFEFLFRCEEASGEEMSLSKGAFTSLQVSRKVIVWYTDSLFASVHMQQRAANRGLTTGRHATLIFTAIAAFIPLSCRRIWSDLC